MIKLVFSEYSKGSQAGLPKVSFLCLVHECKNSIKTTISDKTLYSCKTYLKSSEYNMCLHL